MSKTIITVTIHWAPVCQAMSKEHRKQVSCDPYNHPTMYSSLFQLNHLSEETDKLCNLHKIILASAVPRRNPPDLPDSKCALQFSLPLSVTTHALHNHFFKTNIMAVVKLSSLCIVHLF